MGGPVANGRIVTGLFAPWLLVLAACRGGSEEAPPSLPVAAEEATFATVASLGSYHLQATVRRTTREGANAPAATTLETLDLRWKDRDNWSYALGRDGRVRSEVVVEEGVAWAGDGAGAMAQKGDAEPFRVQVASVWDPWEWGLEGLAASVRHEPGRIELLDGRRAHHHALALVEEASPKRRAWTPTSVSGEVWIDEETAVRLKGQVLLNAVSGGRTQEVELLFSVGSIGVDPGISPPRRDNP